MKKTNETDLPLGQEVRIALTSIARAVGKVAWVVIKVVAVWLAVCVPLVAAGTGLAVLGLGDWGYAIVDAVGIVVAVVAGVVSVQRDTRAARAEHEAEWARLEAEHIARMERVYGSDVAGFDQWLAARQNRPTSVA